MRHYEDINNAENWNTYLKKIRHKKAVVNDPETMSPPSTTNITEDKAPHIADNIPVDHNIYEPESYRRLSVRTGQSTISHRSRKSRIKKSSRTWLLIVSGLIISFISAAVIFSWLERVDNRKFLSSIKKQITKSDTSHETVQSETHIDEDKIILIDDAPSAKENFDFSQGDQIAETIVFDDSKGETETNSSSPGSNAKEDGLHHETSINEKFMEKNYSQKEDFSTPLLNDKPVGEDLPVEISNIDNDAVVEKKDEAEIEDLTDDQNQENTGTGVDNGPDHVKVRERIAVTTQTQKKDDQVPIKAALVVSTQEKSHSATTVNIVPPANDKAHIMKFDNIPDMPVVFEEEFNDNDRQWPEFNTNVAEAFLKSGKYHIEHKAAAGTYSIIHPYIVQGDADFMIQASITSLPGTGRNSYGFIFGAKDASNNHTFRIHNDNSYSIEIIQGGKKKQVSRGKINISGLDRTAGTILSIVKKQNKVLFYINENYVDNLVDRDLFGGNTGFIIEGKGSIAVDWTKTGVEENNKPQRHGVTEKDR